MKRFSDFSEEEEKLDGVKVKIFDILDKEIELINFRITTSQFGKNQKYAILQFNDDNIKKICFTGSNVIMNQLIKYKDQIPFLTTIKQIDKYLTLS